MLPSQVSLKSQRQNIIVNIPLLSIGMDTVTEPHGHFITRESGIGIIHKNMSIEEQAKQVDTVKRSEHGVITNFFPEPEATVREADALWPGARISRVPIVRGEKLVGIVTNRDIRFETNFERKVSEIMTANLVTARRHHPGAGAEILAKQINCPWWMTTLPAGLITIGH